MIVINKSPENNFEIFSENNIDLISSIITASINNDNIFFEDLVKEIINLAVDENFSTVDLVDEAYRAYTEKSNFISSLLLITKICDCVEPIHPFMKERDEYEINNIVTPLNTLTRIQKQTILKNCQSVIFNEEIGKHLFNLES